MVIQGFYNQIYSRYKIFSYKIASYIVQYINILDNAS
jgi:hypothetical protein